MSFAIIETGGKQYKVSTSNILKVEKLNVEKGKKVEFKKVLLVNDDKTVEVGDPLVSGAVVEGMLIENIKDKKIIVFKKRRRQNSRKRYGHRQPLSKIQITLIYCGHEYTKKNGEFAIKIDDQNKVLKERIKNVASKIKQGLPSIPVSLKDELNTNIFLRCENQKIKSKLQMRNASKLEVFTKLRNLKDQF